MSGASTVKERLGWLERMAADGRLHSTAIRVAIVISSYINRQSGEAWPSVERIAAECATPERTVKRVINALCEAGYLEKRRGGFGKSNRYVMAGNRTVDDEAEQVSSTAMGGGNVSVISAMGGLTEEHSGAMGGPNGLSSGAMGGTSVGPWVAPQSGHGWPTNPLIETLEIEPLDKGYISPPPPPCDPKPKGVAIDASFEEFYRAYPRKVSKGSARKAWAKAAKQAEPAVIIAAAERYAQERRSEDPRFTKHPASWLNAEAWQDEPATLMPMAGRTEAPSAFSNRNSAKERTAAVVQHMLASLDRDGGDFQ